MIVPELLTNNRDELIRMMDLCSEFTDYVQIDIMDGEFVPSKSVDVQDLNGIRSFVRSEAHLMVCDPLIWIDAFKGIGTEKIIYHFEIDANHKEIISRIKAAGLKAGIAVNPATKIEEFGFLTKEVDTFLFMSVNPGFYGAQFIPEVLEKIRSFKGRYPDKIVGIDGGVKFDNLRSIRDSGIDYICVGSAILKNPDPKKAYADFLRLYNE
jgi:ribulose-phosphate 3-epimerase